MPITTLDANTALIVIDLQAGIVALPTAHPAAEVVARATELAAGFRRHSLPVVLVNVDAAPPGRTERPRPSFGEGWTVLVPEMDQQPTDLIVTKHSWNALAETGLAETLKGLGVTQVVICGIATSIGVESTARRAFELGFNVTLAVDTMTDVSPEAHDNSIARIFPRLGETGTAREVLDMLDRRAS
ncbi:MAG: isochorismatase family protein [Rhodospirillaceae bacterium]|nr:isochorismatase family protein [Rhodospirillaceae bacterium]